MGMPLKEQIDNPVVGAKRCCEGCYGSGWLTALVDDERRLDEAHVTGDSADFLMKCDECEVFDSDEQAAEAARKAGMTVSGHLVVKYTDEQREYLENVGLVENPELFLLHYIASRLPPEAVRDEELPPQIVSVSVDGDHKSAEIIFELLTTEGLRSYCVSSGTIREIEDDDDE